MTDNEIIKALECCIVQTNCRECPFYQEHSAKCLETACKTALDLINRQKASLFDKEGAIHFANDVIKVLQADLENYKQIAENQQSVSMDKEVEIKRLKAEVERLKEPASVSYVFELSKQAERAVEEHSKYVAKIRAEAVKEFVSRIKEELRNYSNFNIDGHSYYLIRTKFFDSIFKEMGAL